MNDSEKDSLTKYKKRILPGIIAIKSPVLESDMKIRLRAITTT